MGSHLQQSPFEPLPSLIRTPLLLPKAYPAKSASINPVRESPRRGGACRPPALFRLCAARRINTRHQPVNSADCASFAGPASHSYSTNTCAPAQPPATSSRPSHASRRTSPRAPGSHTPRQVLHLAALQSAAGASRFSVCVAPNKQPHTPISDSGCRGRTRPGAGF